ncbi:MAG: exo 1,3/1,4-beta-D-glucan glucohydrolase [Gemmatimonadota bacterium]
MKPRVALLLGFTACFACSAPRDEAGWPTLRSPLPADPGLEARVEELLARMSLEEKVGQIIQADVRRVSAEDVRTYHLGSVLNGGGGFPNDDKHATVGDWLALADMIHDASVDTTGGRVGIPILWGVDAVHGHNNVIGATLFPHNVGLGAAHDPDLIRRIGEVTAREIRVTGHDWNFGPTVAVPRNGRWGRAYEGYAEDPDLVSAYADALVRGLQGEPGSPQFLDDDHVIATAKHFLGDGATDGGTDQGDALVTEEELRTIHGAPYVTALRAGVQSVMASFSSWHGVKMHANRALLTDVLKDTLGFDGVLVGDWNAHGQIPGCTNESCAATINAGVDVFMVPDDWKALYENTLAQARAGQIPAERLDDAVRRILRVKLRAGVFDRGRPSSRRYAGDERVLASPEHRAVARQAVRESLVLLKNNDGLLPLAPGQSVLVTGDGADDIGKQSGGWTLTWQGTGNVNTDFPGATSIWQGVRAAVEAAGGTAQLSPDGSFDPARPPDVALVVFGEDPYAEFQGDRENVDYPRQGKSELDLQRRLRTAGVPVVAVFITGRPLWVNPELNAADAFVVAWLPGSEGGGIADVLFTDAAGSTVHDFTGRLSFSWPRTPDQSVLNRGDTLYDPLFAYGYGLSYGEDGNVPELPEDIGTGVDTGPAVRFFAGGPVAPWRLVVQAADGKRIEASTGTTASPGSELVVRVEDRRVQEDARGVEWDGSGIGRVALTGQSSMDLSQAADESMALAFDVRMDRAPERPVALVVAHDSGGGDVETRLELTPLLAALPVGEWATLRLRLACLEDAGVDLQQVTVPWALETTGPLALAFSDVRLVDEDDGLAECPAVLER